MSERTLDLTGPAGVRRDGPAAAAASPASARPEPGRLSRFGAGLDRGRSIGFVWDGAPMQGLGGDTLASALLANGVRVVGRGFKYHRPRGVTSAGVEEAGAIVSTGRGARRIANVNAATAELADGLEAFGQNSWPNVRFDAARVNDAMGRFFSAGFYYKTFFALTPGKKKGTRDWMLYEKAIRRAAGMGRASREPDPDRYDTAHDFCDVLVVGSGPAGLAAAVALAEAGQDVILAEQDFALGGRLLADGAAVEGEAAPAWRDAQARRLEAAGARVWMRASVFGLYDHGVAGVVERVEHGGLRERCRVVRARRILLATGAIERGLVFEGNDRPGVMSASALRSYVGRFGVAPGKRVVIATANDSGYADLDRLVAAGLEVTLLDARPGPAREVAGVRVSAGVAPLATSGRTLDGRIASVRLGREDAGRWVETGERLECDLLAVSGGWSPTLHLAAHRGAKPVWSAEAAAFLAGPTPPSETPLEIAGAAAAKHGPDACAASGRAAAARILGRAPEPEPDDAPAKPPRALFEVATPGAKGAKSFVDLQHDVTAKDVRLAAREGFVSVEHLKRYTTLGMATDQGKTSNAPGLGILAEALGLEIGAVGTTTFRPPYTPTSIGALAGSRGFTHIEPTRFTPLHDWNLAQGATMTDAGHWKRPWAYPKAGETIAEAYVREAAAVRERLGLCDVTSLGKIQVQGPDAGAFLDRVYVNTFSTLAIGRARYGVMLREDGIAFDDGTVWRLGEHDWLMTTTTAGAGKVMSWLEKLLETRWPELRVSVASVTDRWAGVSVAGPLARRVLSQVIAAVDFSDAALPFMGVREGRLGDRPVKVARISFSGELAYEVYAESDHGAAMAAAIWDAAEPVGGVLYGTEALGALRIEKGHITHAEMDGRTTLEDVGLGAMMSRKKPCIGSALLGRPEMTGAARQQLVGLFPEDGVSTFNAGAILCRPGEVKGHGVGWVSAVTHSPALGHWIGLGLIEGGLAAWEGRIAIAADPVRGQETRLRIVAPQMVDPTHARLKPAADPERAPTAPAPRPAPSRLEAVSALGTRWDGRAEGAVAGGATRVVEPAPERLLRLACFDAEGAAAVEARLREVLGAEPPAPCRLIRGAAGARAMRVGPLEWWVAGADDAAAARLLDASDPAIAPLELSHGSVRLRLEGPRAADLANRLVAVDLRDAAFPTGACAGTGVHHVPATLARPEPEAYELWVPRSYARGVWGLAADAVGRL